MLANCRCKNANRWPNKQEFYQGSRATKYWGDKIFIDWFFKKKFIGGSSRLNSHFGQNIFWMNIFDFSCLLPTTSCKKLTPKPPVVIFSRDNKWHLVVVPWAKLLWRGDHGWGWRVCSDEIPQSSLVVCRFSCLNVLSILIRDSGAVQKTCGAQNQLECRNEWSAELHKKNLLQGNTHTNDHSLTYTGTRTDKYTLYAPSYTHTNLLQVDCLWMAGLVGKVLLAGVPVQRCAVEHEVRAPIPHLQGRSSVPGKLTVGCYSSPRPARHRLNPCLA